MPRVLLTWELGAGQGHAAQIEPLAHGLAQRGYDVHVALRDLSRAHGVLRLGQIHLLQAPTQTRTRTAEIAKPRTFAQILHNCGYSSPTRLAAVFDAWRNVYDTLQPDMLIFDYSPTA